MGEFCTHCGERLNAGAKFCGNCGKAVKVETVERRATPATNPYRPVASSGPRQEHGRSAPVQPRQSSGGFWHFLAGTALGGFFGNLFGSSAAAHPETIINHNETIFNGQEDEKGLGEESLDWERDDEDLSSSYGNEYDEEGAGEDYEEGFEDDSYDADYDSDSYDDESYGYDGGDSYNDSGSFDDFGGDGDDFF